MTPKNKIMRNIRNMMEPYLAFDKEGIALDKMSEMGYFAYRSNIKRSGRDFEPEEFDLRHARRAVKSILRHNLDDIDPNVNGLPTQPFEPEMTADAMNEIFQSLTEEDLLEMNDGDPPVDAPELGATLSINQIKKGWPVFVSPGKYAIAVGDSPDQMNYAVSKRSGKLYMFDYGMKADELRSRRVI